MTGTSLPLYGAAGGVLLAGGAGLVVLARRGRARADASAG
ncbi:LPXTG cell wall anchor domain-containing protein [Actinocatenispora rupis]|nr:LPXTG cell wall anchor domain-containing protein [Actinocatenispora rupis]